jgi:competence protein ComEC
VYFQILSVSTSGARTAGPEQRAVIASSTLAGPVLAWTMIDVGFGDSHLLTFPTAHARLLVDGGERRDASNVLRFLADHGVAALDAVLATHLHLDHLGGLVGDEHVDGDGVIEALPVGSLLEGANPSGNAWEGAELGAAASAHGVPVVLLRPGDTDATQPALQWDSRVHVQVLNAGGGRATGGADEADWINNDSVVLRLTYGDVDLILGGDAEAPVEARWHGQGTRLESEVLKVHHHGVADATESAYLDDVRPRVGLIPIATYESYGGSLPSGVVLGRLRDHAVDVFASDRAEPLDLAPAGAAGMNVTVFTDGASVEVSVEPSRSVHVPGGAGPVAAAPHAAAPRGRKP